MRRASPRSRSTLFSDLLTASPAARTRALRSLGFQNPRAAGANLEALTPTPREAELLAPVLPRLMAELAAKRTRGGAEAAS